MEIDDVEYGQYPVLKVHSNKSMTGKICITCGSRYYYCDPIENGYFERELNDDFEVGNHTVTVWFYGDDTFKPVEINETFAVKG